MSLALCLFDPLSFTFFVSVYISLSLCFYISLSLCFSVSLSFSVTLFLSVLISLSLYFSLSLSLCLSLSRYFSFSLFRSVSIFIWWWFLFNMTQLNTEVCYRVGSLSIVLVVLCHFFYVFMFLWPSVTLFYNGGSYLIWHSWRRKYVIELDISLLCKIKEHNC
jgi:hypothetical protein